jgi:hypothetical protein
MLQFFELSLWDQCAQCSKAEKAYFVYYKKCENLLCCVITASIAYTDASIQNKSDFIIRRFVVYFTILVRILKDLSWFNRRTILALD